MSAQHSVVFCLGEVVRHVSDQDLLWLGDVLAWDRWGDFDFLGVGDFCYCSEQFAPYISAEVWVACFFFEGDKEEFHSSIIKPFIQHEEV